MTATAPACKENNQTCDANSDCCSSYCTQTGQYKTCQPSINCKSPGTTCTTAGECCSNICTEAKCQSSSTTGDETPPVDNRDCYYSYCDVPTSYDINSICNGNVCETGIGPINTTDFAGFAQSIFSILLSLAGLIAAILIIISGYKLVLSRGNPEKVQDAREQLTAAIVGLLFIIFSLVFLEFIGLDVLGLPNFLG
jgi:hypothetical protein